MTKKIKQIEIYKARGTKSKYNKMICKYPYTGMVKYKIF